MAGADPVVKPKPTTTPAPTKPGTNPNPRPSRPGVVPTERPSEEDAPLAATDNDVITRFEEIYKGLDKNDKDEINSYFE